MIIPTLLIKVIIKICPLQMEMENENKYFDIFNNEIDLENPAITEETPKTEIMDEYFTNGTKHEVVIPFNTQWPVVPRVSKCTAKEYKFKLDTFQEISISAIENNQSVMVSAHTSCGKTVVAEYAIAQSIKNSQRVIYTSPIKALSNQKYRELQEEFGDVGLMTGDITINPMASCLVMTTEILRNMLYKGSEVIREVHWIIFDEIHYMRDKERGVVWEETIILMPKHIRMIFLSATIPNALEFAEWACFISQQPIHVVYTEKRVIPLIHYFYSDEMYLAKDTAISKKGCLDAMAEPVKRQDVAKAINGILEKASLPAVVFSFSRKDCETYAMKVSKDFLNEEEKATVKMIFEKAIESLREEDRKIPLIQNMLPILQRGIGIHHSGLLPIIKEIIEILFQESLVKILFATETFSIGLNMPAKTVIFTTLRKFDGTNRRLLSSGEYIQMSGRAGRRGLDKQGIVISIITEGLSLSQIKTMFLPCSDTLYSAFRLTYNMILSLLRVEGLDPMYVLSRSFYHFQAYKRALREQNKLFEALKEYENSLNYTPDSVEEALKDNLEKREEAMILLCKRVSSTYRDYIENKGRIVDLYVPRGGSGLLIRNAIVRWLRNDNLSVFVLTDKDIEVKEYPLSYVLNVYDIRCKVDLKVFNKRFQLIEYKDDELKEEIAEIEERIRKVVPAIDFGECLFCKAGSRSCLVKCGSDGDKSNNKKGTAKSTTASNAPSASNDILSRVVSRIRSGIKRKEIEKMIQQFEELKEIYHMEECKKMMNVLKDLEYVDDTGVLLKGKMASEISTGDELVLTEMIFNSRFTELELVDMVALLSCVICEEKPKEGNTMEEENVELYEILENAVRRVCASKNRCGIEEKFEDYMDKFSMEMMKVVKMWMRGCTFIEVCQSTTVFEGSIIRMFKRLEELLRQLCDAAQVIGNQDLVNIFSQGIFAIKKDIVFANSLYL